MIKEQTLKNMSIPCIFIYLIISLYSIYQYLKTSIDFISELGNNIFMNRENISLEDELKAFIIEALELEDITPSDIDTDAPLFIDGLGLDSIDALELGMALKKKYKLSLGSDKEENKKHFYSVKTLADFIRNSPV